MFETEILPYLKDRQENELATIYGLIIYSGFKYNNVLLVDKACEWMFAEVAEGSLTPEIATEIYSQVMDRLMKDPLVANLFAKTAVEVAA